MRRLRSKFRPNFLNVIARCQTTRQCQPSVQADGATAAIASTASMSFTTKGGALASRDQQQEAGAEESGAARDRGRHRCERIDETRPRDPHTASRVSLGASRLKERHRKGDDARLLFAAIPCNQK